MRQCCCYYSEYYTTTYDRARLRHDIALDRLAGRALRVPSTQRCAIGQQLCPLSVQYSVPVSTHRTTCFRPVCRSHEARKSRNQCRAKQAAATSPATVRGGRPYDSGKAIYLESAVQHRLFCPYGTPQALRPVQLFNERLSASAETDSAGGLSCATRFIARCLMRGGYAGSTYFLPCPTSPAR
jgi:hypothetical protein